MTATSDDVKLESRNAGRTQTQRNWIRFTAWTFRSWSGRCGGRGHFMSVLFSGIITAMTLFALIPLFSVVGLLLWRGGRKLSIAAFTQLPPAPLDQNGGFGNAIVGTLVDRRDGAAHQRPHRNFQRDLPGASRSRTTAWRRRCALPPKC